MTDEEARIGREIENVKREMDVLADWVATLAHGTTEQHHTPHWRTKLRWAREGKLQR